MNWLKSAWLWLRKLPIAQWIKPLWKQALKDLIQKEGDNAQVLLVAAVKADGAGSIEKVIDGWLRSIVAGLSRLPLPSWARQPIVDMLTRHGQQLKNSLASAVADKGPGAVDIAFDASQAVLISRIDAL